MMTYSFMCVNKAIPIHASTEFTAFRDFQNFKKRRGDLPTQLEGDAVDVRGLMHRDGSVFSTVSLEDLRNPNQLYVSLGAKTVVGLPFKDIATSDSIYLPEVPPVEDAASRRTLKRLQEVGVGVLADIEKLVLTPIDNSVAITPLTSLSAGLPALPQGSIRYAISVTGTEDAALYQKLAELQKAEPRIALLIINVPAPTSNVHASRRVFQLLSDNNLSLPVVHQISLDVKDKDQLIFVIYQSCLWS